MRTFKVNGKNYTAKAFDFNTVCDLDEMGIGIESLGDKPMSLMRAYFSLCSGLSIERAGNEIEKHITSGNTLDELADAMKKEIEESDFFRSLNQTTEEETQATPTKKTTTKKA